MKRIELTKEIKSKIETFTYNGIDEAINLAEEHGTIDFFDKFLGELQLRCVRYNSDHVCSEAKFFNRGMRVKSSHFTYRALLGLVNIACKGSKAYEFRNKMKKIEIIGHIWQNGTTYNGNVDLKYITNFSALTDIQIEEAGTISNLELINSFKSLKSLSICGPRYTLDTIPYSLRDIPLLSTKLSIPAIKCECELLENISLQCIEDIENLQFIAGLKNLKSIDISFCKIDSLAGLPSSIENFMYSGSRIIKPFNDSEFEYLRNLKKLKTVQIVSTNSDFSFLADLTELEQLTISSEAEKVIIPDLIKLKNLRYISFSKATESFDFLSKNQDIEKIFVLDSNISNIKGLGNCKKIKVMYVTNCKKLTSLSGLENCKELDITIRNAGLENLDGLKNCTRLSQFRTHVLEDFHKYGFYSTEVETFSDGTNDLDSVIRNNTLYVSECNSLVDISGIKNATNLMGLSFTYCKNIKKIDGIDTLKNIYDIDFSNCSELEDISFIKNYPKLKYLNLTGCKKLKIKPEKSILETKVEVDNYKNKL